MGRRQDPGGAAQAEAPKVELAKVRTAKVRTAKAGFSDLVLVCRKCAKRQGVDSKRIGRAVKRALKPVSRETAGGKVRIVETGCLGPCPKRMLTLATPDSLARRRVILVDPALDALSAAALSLDPAAGHAGPRPVPSEAPLRDGAWNG